MNKYRIRCEYKDRYIVEKKKLWWWSNCVKDYCKITMHPFNKIFFSYAAAKEELEKKIKRDTDHELYLKEKAAFKIRYYYPPLPNQEPEE